METKTVKYRKIGKSDGGELNCNIYQVTVAGEKHRFKNNRAAKRFRKGYLKVVGPSLKGGM